MEVGGGTSLVGGVGWPNSDERPSETPMSTLTRLEEITPSPLNVPQRSAGAVGWPNSKSRLGSVMLSKCGVEVGGVVATKWAVTGAPHNVGQRVLKGGDGTALGLAAKSSLGKMMAHGGDIHARVPVAGLELARKPKVPETAEQGKPLGLSGRTGEPVCGPGTVTL